MSFGPGNIRAWGTVHVNPVLEKLGANQESAQIHCPFGLGRHVTTAGKRIHLIKGRHPLAPMGCSHPLDATALLIDQDRCISPDGFAKRCRQAAKLVWRLAVPLKHDEPEWLCLGEKPGFPGTKLRPGRCEDIRALWHLLLHDRNAVCTIRLQYRAKAPGIGQIDKARGPQTEKRAVT